MIVSNSKLAIFQLFHGENMLHFDEMLFNSKLAIVQLFHGENMLHFVEMMMLVLY